MRSSPRLPADIRKALAIRMGRLGDVILLLPALAALKIHFPSIQIVLVTDHRYAAIAELCPLIDEIIPVNRLAMRDGPKSGSILSMARLVENLRAGNFDLAFDFHGFRETQLLVWLSRARCRAGLKRPGKPFWGFCFNQPPIPEDKSIHVGEMFERMVDSVAGRSGAIFSGKLLVPPPSIQARMRDVLPGGPTVAFYVGARAGDHVWAPERFSSLADLAIEQFGASVVVIGGSSASEAKAPTEIRKLCKHREEVHVLENLTIVELVAVISCCRILVSNDSGPMHIGPAVTVPTLGLFSLSSPQHYRPSGSSDKAVWAPDIRSIAVDQVFLAMQQMWESQPIND